MRIKFLAVLAIGLIGLSMSRTDARQPLLPPAPAISISTIGGGDTISSQTVIGGFYSPDPPPGEIWIELRDSCNAIVFTQQCQWGCGTWCGNVTGKNGNGYTVRAYIKGTTASASVINITVENCNAK